MAAVSLSDLKNVHRLQVTSYNKIIDKKTKEHGNEVAGAFDDAIDLKLLEDMYSQKDACKFMQAVNSVVQDQVSVQYNTYAQRSGLFMQQLYKGAESKEIGLKIELNQLDSSHLLDGLDKLFIDPKSAPQLGAGGKLSSLGHGGVDVTLVQKLKDVDKEVASAQAKFDNKQNEAKDEMKRNMDLKSKLKILREQAAATATDASNAKAGNEKAQDEQIQQLKKAIAAEKNGDALDALRADLKQTKAELAGSIAASTQFKTLKTMIQDKNKQVKALRDELKSAE